MRFKLILVIIVIIGVIMVMKTSNSSSKPQFGVFFSPSYASELGLDWREVYQAVLTDLNVKQLRLPTYWNRTEVAPGKLDFSEIDYMLSEANKQGVVVSLVLGAKQPRWPECHIPDWARKLPLKARQSATLDYIQAVVKRYQDQPQILSYQVENEPFFAFGSGCDPLDAAFLASEVKLVRSLDPNKPIIITETGEWSNWIRAMGLSDILGISIYRYAYSPSLGYFSYPFPVQYYTLKSALIRKLFAPHNQQTIVTELQAEPWFTTVPTQTPIEQHLNLFSLKQLRDNIDFSEQTNFTQVYLWGVEWWYYMAKQGHPEYWDHVKKLTSSD